VADEGRFGRLEDKVDEVKTEVSELRTDFKIHVSRVEDKMDIFAEHITGDNKIINHLQPVLKQLPELTGIIQDYKFQKELEKRKSQKRKKAASVLGIASLVIGIMVGISKLL
jgi:hypothetical protein